MKPLLHLTHILLLAVNLATADRDHLPPLDEVVVDYVEAVETVTVNGEFPEAFFIDRVQGHVCYIDARWFDADNLPIVERVAGEWRMFWYDDRDDCYRIVYTPHWLLTDCRDWSQTPKFNGCGLSRPAGRWW